MKSHLTLIFAVVIVLLPLIMPYINRSSGIEELPIDNFVYYSLAVCGILFIILDIVKLYLKKYKKIYFFLLYDSEDSTIANKIITEVSSKRVQVLPPTLDFYIANTSERNKVLDHYMKLASCALVIVGEKSLDSEYFNSTLKILRKSKHPILTLLTSDTVELPTQLNKGQLPINLDFSDTQKWDIQLNIIHEFINSTRSEN